MKLSELAMFCLLQHDGLNFFFFFFKYQVCEWIFFFFCHFILFWRTVINFILYVHVRKKQILELLLNFLILQPASPESVRRFRASVRPDTGKMKVFYGKAYDPELVMAAEMRHGRTVPPSGRAGDTLNPIPNSLFKQSIINKRESLYHSNQRAPLGVSHDQSSGFPEGLDPSRIIFGNVTEKGAWEIYIMS